MRYGISLGNSNLGRLCIGHLLEKGVAPGDIVAVARSTDRAADLADQGLEVRPGEYGDDASMLEALKGVDRLYLISGMAAPPERIQQHRGAIEAARRAGVSRIVYTSFLDATDDSPFFAWTINQDSESALRASGVPHTVLRNGMYSEADLDYIPQYLQAGKVANNIGPDGLTSYISRRDLTLAAAHCLLDDGHEGKTYELTGPEAVTQVQLAALISEWTGQDVPYETVPDEEYAATFPDPHWAEVVVTLYQMVREGRAAKVSEDFEAIVGRKALTLRETLERYYRD